MTVSRIRNFKNYCRIRSTRSGLTLIEIMVALTMTLIVLGAMMSAFRFAGEKMQLGRSVMEMANRLRTAEELLRSDLANLTIDPRPYTASTSPNGFFEYIEGAGDDSSGNASLSWGGAANNYVGDIDDVIGMTVRSPDGRKFRGTVLGAVQESTMAEVWYFPFVNEKNVDGVIDLDDSVKLHRRALLIRPDLYSASGGRIGSSGRSLANVQRFVRNNDLSVRVIADDATFTSFSIFANSLADLAVRKNRFAHVIDEFAVHHFPNEFDTGSIGTLLKGAGGDVLLSDVAAFDIRIYSPNATVQGSAAILVEPGDIGYTTGAAGNQVGAFVDLGFNPGSTAGEWFSANATAESQCFFAGVSNCYDTWTTFYEHDGINQDLAQENGTAAAPVVVDQGTNGLNDPVIDAGATAAPDDNAERETRPPYPYPVRGIKVTMRLIEKNTKQVQQTSIIQSYVPE